MPKRRRDEEDDEEDDAEDDADNVDVEDDVDNMDDVDDEDGVANAPKKKRRRGAAAKEAREVWNGYGIRTIKVPLKKLLHPERREAFTQWIEPSVEQLGRAAHRAALQMIDQLSKHIEDKNDKALKSIQKKRQLGSTLYY
ncbi:MAG: hypothetical protein MI748_09845 [Opitutales bacterium]|nr:hypothetical protein [Opitutales bacterium]